MSRDALGLNLDEAGGLGRAILFRATVRCYVPKAERNRKPAALPLAGLAGAAVQV